MECGYGTRLVPYLLDELERAARSEFEKHVRACPACRADLATFRSILEADRRATPAFSEEDWAGFESALRERLQNAAKGGSSRRLDPVAIRAAAQRRRRASSRRRHSARGSRARAWIRYAVVPLAAAAAFLLAVHVYNVRQIRLAHEALCAEIVEVRGETGVVRENGRSDAEPRTRVGPGEKIETGEDASVTLEYPDGSTIELDEETAISVLEHGRSKRLGVTRGAVYIKAAKQLQDRPMVLNPGRHDELTVVGTAFEFAVKGAETVVRVEEGKVWFGAGESAIAVAALETSRAGADAAPSEAEPVALAAIAPWRYAPAPTPEPETGLVGYWKLDETKGPTAFDSSGRGNHGTISGVARGPGQTGRAFYFHHEEAGRVEIPAAKSLGVTKALTIAAWVRIGEQTNPDITQQPFLAVGHEGPERNYRFSVCRTGKGPEDWRLRLSHGWEGSSLTWRTRATYTEIVPQRDGWMHVAFTVTVEDGGAYAAYVDGGEVRTYATLTSKKGKRIEKTFSELTPVDAPVRIESFNEFQGGVDEVRIYNRALSAEEIARLAGAEAGGAPGATR